MIFHSQMGPRTTQELSRQPQDGLRDLLFSLWFLPSNLDRFGLRFGPLLGAFWTPRSAQNRSQNISKLCWGDRPSPDHPRRPQDHPKRPQDPPKDSQEAPRGTQDASKSPPGGTHETLRCPSKLLRCPLEASKFAPKFTLRLLGDVALKLKDNDYEKGQAECAERLNNKKALVFTVFSFQADEKALILLCFRFHMLEKHWFYCIFVSNSLQHVRKAMALLCFRFDM